MMPKVERRGDCSILGPFAMLVCLVGLVVYSAKNWREAIEHRMDKSYEELLVVTGVSRDRRDLSALKTLVTSAKLTMGDHISFLVFVDDGNRYRELQTWDSVKPMTYRELLAGTGVRSIHKSHDHWMAMVREGLNRSTYVLYATADYQFKRGGSFAPLINSHNGHFAVMNHHKHCGTELQGFKRDSEVAYKILDAWVGHPMREFNSSTATCIPSFAIGVDLATPAATGKHLTPRVNSTFVKQKVRGMLTSLKRLPYTPPTVQIKTKLTAAFLLMLPADASAACSELHLDDSCGHSDLVERFVRMLKDRSLEYEVAVVAGLHLPHDSPHTLYSHWEAESTRISSEYNINTKIVVMDTNILKHPSSYTYNVLSDSCERAFGAVGGYCVVNPLADLPAASGWESLPHKFESYNFVGVHDPLNSSFCIPTTTKEMTTWIIPPALSVATSYDWFEGLYDEPKTVLVSYENKQLAASIHPDFIHQKPLKKSTGLPSNEFGVYLEASKIRLQDKVSK